MQKKFYVKVDIEKYYDEEEEYLSVDVRHFDIEDYLDFSIECRKWICRYINDNCCYNSIYDFDSYRFVFYLKTESGDFLNHMQYDIPWYIMRLFNVFKSEICEINRAEGRKEAD